MEKIELNTREIIFHDSKVTMKIGFENNELQTVIIDTGGSFYGSHLHMKDYEELKQLRDLCSEAIDEIEKGDHS